MWRLTSIIHFLVLYQYSIPQPIKNERGNVRQSRQLDVGECCPCPGSSQRGFDHESATSFGEGMPDDGGWGMGDCPCGRRLGDAEAASSIFSPNAMRAAGTFFKPTKNKEDIKPLLHPEVDLASSVLETLREATNEEYREALARDAVRDAVNIAGLSDSTFKDAAPEESRSIVTIIMNPNEDDDDTVPQASHQQASRCIHKPLGTVRSSLFSNLKVAPKSPNEIFAQENARRVSLHRHLMDMDNNIGASNVQEHLENVGEDAMNNRDVGIRPRDPLLKRYPQSPSLLSNERNSDFEPSLTTNLLKNPLNTASLLFQNIKDSKTRPIIPKSGLETSLFKNKNITLDNNLLNSNNVNEKVLASKSTPIKEIVSFRKPYLQSILENTRPLNLKTFLKLKDVELLPLHNFNKTTAVIQPKIFSTKLSRKNNDAVKNLRSKTRVGLLSNGENNEFNSKLTSDENCFTKSLENQRSDIQTVTSNTFNIEPELFDTMPNPSNTVFNIDKNRASSKDLTPITDNVNDCKAEHKSKTTTDNENTESALKTEFEIDEIHCSTITSDNEISELTTTNRDYETEEKNSSRTVIDNSTPGCIINIKDHIEPKKQQEIMTEQNMIPQESSSHKNTESTQNYIVETTTVKYKPHKLLGLDKTMLSIKANIKNNLENLKSINSDVKNVTEQNKYTARVTYYDDDKIHHSDLKIQSELDSAGDESEHLDCVTINPEQSTTLRPISDNNMKNGSKDCDSVTIQELQKISDEMLQREGISDALDETCETNENSIDDRSTENMLEFKGKESENHDSKTSANHQNDDVLPVFQVDETISTVNSDNIMANICEEELSRDIPISLNQKNNSKTTDMDITEASEMNSDASNLVINKLSRGIIPLVKNPEYPLTVDNIQLRSSINNNPLNVFEAPFPEVRNIIKLDTLPTLDDIKLKLSNMFNTNEQDTHGELSQEKYCLSASPSALKPNMVTDGSTANFLVKQPPMLKNRENFDIFQLKPLRESISNFRSPSDDFELQKTKLFPKDPFIKPIKLQPLLGNTEDLLSSKPSFPNIFYATPKVSNVLDDIIEKIPSFVDLRDKIRSNTQELLNTPSFLENLNDKLDLSDFKNNAENSIKNIQYKLKAAENDFNIISPMKSSHNILDTIAERHEDLSDKLRAVHIDFNDRFESIRNSLINPTYQNNDRKKTNIKSFSNSGIKDRQLNSRTPAQVSNKKEPPLKSANQKRLKPITSQDIDQRVFKMPTAASMPIPKTFEVPKLKETAMKPTLSQSLENASIFKSSIQSTEPPSARKSTILVKEAINNLQNANRQLGVKHIDPLKNSKVTVTFSTTPRPSQATRLLSTAIPIAKQIITAREDTITDSGLYKNKNQLFKDFRDSNGALSETKAAIQAPEPNINNRFTAHLDESNTLEETGKPSIFQTWPKATESSFLAKVKEAVTARLPKSNMANKLGGELPTSLLGSKVEDCPSVSDTQTTLENLDIVREEPLQENKSYKCRMVCTRE